jgi:hypothetical protein
MLEKMNGSPEFGRAGRSADLLRVHVVDHERLGPGSGEQRSGAVDDESIGARHSRTDHPDRGDDVADADQIEPVSDHPAC